MGFSDLSPDQNSLLQCALRLKFFNDVLCQKLQWTNRELDQWHNYMFQFGVLFSHLFKVDVSTKLHCLTRHKHHHLVHLGCIRCGSPEDNEMAHKEFKCLYNGAKNM